MIRGREEKDCRLRYLFFHTKVPGLVISRSYGRVMPRSLSGASLPPPLFSASSKRSQGVLYPEESRPKVGDSS
jgi:hypothetical protein